MHFVHLLVRMEALALIYLSLFTTVPVPVGTKDPTCTTEVHTTKNILASCCIHAGIGP